MRQRIEKQSMVMATSVKKPMVSKRKHPGHASGDGNAPQRNLKTRQQKASVKKAPLSKKDIQKLIDKKIGYRPFTLFKETPGVEGNYRKLIYNTPKY